MLILASKSPRRIELLAGLGVAFSAVESLKDEVIPLDCPPATVVMELAKQKVEDVFKRTTGIVIGADTVMCHKDRILGKPVNEDEAFLMLGLLSGKWHEVYTGVCIKDDTKIICEYEKTRVKFRQLSEEEIMRYIQTKEPMDKAGAYGIQGLGSLLVERIEGDYFNVVGLPICRLGTLLKEHFAITLL